jgi:glutamate 5-kinase
MNPANAAATTAADGAALPAFSQARRVVVKVGSSLVTNRGQGLDRDALARWASQIARLRAGGREIVLVSSGAIAEGMQRLGWAKRPSALHELQAAAAVGQMGLAQVYESCFREHGLLTSQILLTHEDLADRRRYLNARSTLITLLGLAISFAVDLPTNQTLCVTACGLLLLALPWKSWAQRKHVTV